MIKDHSRFGPCGCSRVPFNNLVWCWVMKPKRHLQEPDLTLVAPILLDSDKFCKLLPFFCSFWQYECCCHIMKYQCSIVLQKMHSLLDPLCFSSRCLKGSFQVPASQGQKNGVFKRIQGESDWDCKSFCFSILLFFIIIGWKCYGLLYVLLRCYCILVIPYSHDCHDGSENVPPLENKIS